MRQAGFEAAGLFDERYRISMDYDLYLRLGRYHDPVVIDEYLSDFRMVEGTLSMSGFETQFREHAEQARRHGHDHRLAVTVNQLSSRMIVSRLPGDARPTPAPGARSRPAAEAATARAPPAARAPRPPPPPSPARGRGPPPGALRR